MRAILATAAAACLLTGCTADAHERWYDGPVYGGGPIYGAPAYAGPPPWAHGGGRGWGQRDRWYGGPRTVIVEPRRRWYPPSPPRRSRPGVTVTNPFPYR